MIPVDELLSGRYRIDRLLGQGGMADVFRAVDLTDSSAVAVKVVRSGDPALAQRLATEAKALARLEHPGLVRLLDAGVHDGQAYLVMELVEGPTLAARLRRGPLSPARAAVLGRTLASALAFVHGQGIVHRDVKPANVLLGPGPRARLADFGIARLADASSLTVTGTTLGTAAYMAPEQLEHHAVGTSADVWSLGMILLECLTGQRVFEGTATEVVARRLAGPVPLPRDLPATWRLLFEGMLAPEPARRPTASHVAGLLSAGPFAEPWERRAEETMVVPGVSAPATANGPHTPHAFPTVAVGAVAGAAGGNGETLMAHQRAEPPAPRPAPRRRSPWLWAVIAAAVLLAAGLTAWALSAKSPKRTPPHVTTTTAAPTTSTTAPTTTTTSPTAGSAAAALLTDVQTGTNNGSVTPGAARSLRDDLNQALSASSEGNQGQTAQAVDAMIGTINDEVQKGTMTEAESSTLFSDVAALANVLGVSTTPPTTSPTSTTPGGNTGSTGNTGNGNGHGH